MLCVLCASSSAPSTSCSLLQLSLSLLRHPQLSAGSTSTSHPAVEPPFAATLQPFSRASPFARRMASPSAPRDGHGTGEGGGCFSSFSVFYARQQVSPVNPRARRCSTPDLGHLFGERMWKLSPGVEEEQV
ncbi:hypothetical protein WMY93_023596 [Mugilogobius chulae]|uniref:Secreted protein n=1 Tax=Mugilogobius chulae TaxID=88201 RepID=A0AAW0N9R4_9GOBI